MCTDYTIKVTNLLGQYVLVNKICKSFPLRVKGYNFPASLMLLPFNDFDLIQGMDRLYEHDAIVSCRRKQVSLKCLSGDYVCVRADEIDFSTSVISILTTHKMVRKGCKAYLAYVLEAKVKHSKLDQVPVVKLYADVFPKELPRFTPPREAEFGIELVLRTTPISIAPYRMALVKLKKLKAQLQELLE